MIDLSTIAALDQSVDALRPIGLDELVATADLQTRKDRKYLVSVAALPAMMAELDGASVLTIDSRNSFTYRSTYFDTEELTSYFDAARRRPSRFKVRTRNYLDSNTCMLEVKTRDRRRRTVKKRISCDPSEEVGLSPDAQRLVASIGQTSQVAHRLAPTLTTTYDRTTIALPGHLPARVTIDVDLAWQASSGQVRRLDSLALIETKTPGRPCPFDQILWQHGYRPIKISKYCVGLAASNPQLPANKWNRVLRQHFGWRPASIPE